MGPTSALDRHLFHQVPQCPYLNATPDSAFEGNKTTRFCYEIEFFVRVNWLFVGRVWGRKSFHLSISLSASNNAYITKPIITNISGTI